MYYDILIYGIFDAPTGSASSIIDLYYNLIKYFNVHIKFYTRISPTSLIIKIKENYGDDTQLLKSVLCNNDYINCNILICTSRVFNEITPSINCNYLIMLDSWDLYRANKYNTLSQLWEKVFKVYTSNLYILGNPSNFRFFPMNNNIYEYYHKFSTERLNYIRPIKTINMNFCRTNININNKIILKTIKNKHTVKNIFNCHKYYFSRWDHGEDIYFENIGKLLFEFLYFKRDVVYTIYNRYEVDGLTYYLKQININDEYNQYISWKNVRSYICDKLFMHDDDLLLKLIRDLS